MIPGMNKKQMKQMERQMKKMGMKMEELEGVREVIIRFDEKELIIDNPSVSLMNVMGNETYQIDGKAREVELDYEIEIPEEDITDYIKGNITSVNDEFIPIIEKGLQEYADNVEAKLREIKVDLKHENIIYVGGGASVMKKFGRTKGMNIQYVTDVKANAIGYRYLADNIG